MRSNANFPSANALKRSFRFYCEAIRTAVCAAVKYIAWLSRLLSVFLLLMFPFQGPGLCPRAPALDESQHRKSTTANCCPYSSSINNSNSNRATTASPSPSSPTARASPSVPRHSIGPTFSAPPPRSTSRRQVLYIATTTSNVFCSLSFLVYLGSPRRSPSRTPSDDCGYLRVPYQR